MRVSRGGTAASKPMDQSSKHCSARPTYNARMNIAQLAVEGLERFGEYKSISFQDRWYTNRQIMHRAQQLATVLQQRGVGPGDRVVVMMETNIEVACAFQAIPRIGAILIPIMPQCAPPDCRSIEQRHGRDDIVGEQARRTD